MLSNIFSVKNVIVSPFSLFCRVWDEDFIESAPSHFVSHFVMIMNEKEDLDMSTDD